MLPQIDLGGKRYTSHPPCLIGTCQHYNWSTMMLSSNCKTLVGMKRSWKILILLRADPKYMPYKLGPQILEQMYQRRKRCTSLGLQMLDGSPRNKLCKRWHRQSNCSILPHNRGTWIFLEMGRKS